MLMRIRKHNQVYIQCHNVPDADAIGTAFALQKYLEANNTKATIIYGGHSAITKSNLLTMITKLGIELEHVTSLPPDAVIVTVDCQYGAGNVQSFECERFYSIDHHRPEIEETDDTYIHPSVGSCCTLIWKLLKQQDYAFPDDVATALYYGLFSDTNSLSELYHPLDKDMCEQLNFDAGLIKLLKNTVLNLGELRIASMALSECKPIKNIGLLQAAPCDPNILGYISDLAQQVDTFDAVVAFSVLPSGIKLSVRSTVREIMANELAQFIAGKIGTAGGNTDKAGGFICVDKLKECGEEPAEYICTKLSEYTNYYLYIYSDNYVQCVTQMERYVKLKKTIGYAKTTEIFAKGTQLVIRTLEGDINLCADESTYIMIGLMGEVYPIKSNKFNASYVPSETHYTISTEYEPTVIDKTSGLSKNIAAYAYECVPSQAVAILAMPLSKPAKVFSKWDNTGYFYGEPGDMLACRADDNKDIYIIRRDIFDINYLLEMQI